MAPRVTRPSATMILFNEGKYDVHIHEEGVQLAMTSHCGGITITKGNAI